MKKLFLFDMKFEVISLAATPICNFQRTYTDAVFLMSTTIRQEILFYTILKNYCEISQKKFYYFKSIIFSKIVDLNYVLF